MLSVTEVNRALAQRRVDVTGASSPIVNSRDLLLLKASVGAPEPRRTVVLSGKSFV
jgi:hypothetical protein